MEPGRADQPDDHMVPIVLIAVVFGVVLIVIAVNVLTGGELLNFASGGGNRWNNWRSDDDDWGLGSRSSRRRSSFSSSSFSSSGSFEGGGSFRGGGASGRW